MKVKILEPAYHRLTNIQMYCEGGLYGIFADNNLIVTQFCVNSPACSDSDCYMDMQMYIPSGIDYCGVFRCTKNKEGPISKQLITYMKEVLVSNNPILFSLEPKDENPCALTLRERGLAPITYTVMTMEEFNAEFIYIRMLGSLNLQVSGEGEIIWNDAQKTALLEHSVFHFCGTEIYLISDESCRTPYPKIDLESITKSVEMAREPRIAQAIMNMELLASMGYRDCNDRGCLEILPGEEHKKYMSTSVDALSVAPTARLVDDLYGLLADAIWRQVQLFSNIFQNFNSYPHYINSLQQYHFYPERVGHFFTLIHPNNSSDVQLRPFIEQAITQFGLPGDIPIFLRGNRLKFKNVCESPKLLFNVHVGLKPSGIKDGQEAIVKGFYTYHHYMQDGFNDDGWGCAYRSFQTLFSWFRWNGYTDKPIPSIKEIQECLVSIGDKEKKFIGSKEWIGSSEVGYCLDTMLGVTCITQPFGSGGAISQSSNDLIHHFTHHGTPIMIGGGALAHTILGVHYNEVTNEIKYLILDPHYTGSEDLKTIHTKGWVGWKGVDFWKKTSFYNMCIPLKPRLVVVETKSTYQQPD